jgi:hypothetical protein
MYSYLFINHIPCKQKISDEENRKSMDMKLEREKEEKEIRNLMQLENKEKVIKFKTVKLVLP